MCIRDSIDECRKTFPSHYVRVTAFDATRGWESVRLAFLVQRPPVEPSFELLREECEGRLVRYTLRTLRTATLSAP